MERIVSFDLKDGQPASAAAQNSALDALECGSVVFLPRRGFAVREPERALFSPSVVGNSKNVSYDSRIKKVGGTSLTGAQAEIMRGMLERFSAEARHLLRTLLPRYDRGTIQGRASFRPVEIEGRSSSWRKDDTRLHVDSFPSSPTQGKRILRLFINVNPDGRPRHWRLDEPFENVAERFLPVTSRPFPGQRALLQLFRVTKSRRSEYDHLMLQFHDLMKADMTYQKEVDHMEYDFPSGSTWLAYADQVSHAVTRGQYQFEQTFLVPVNEQVDPARSPLKVLERMTGRSLV